VGGGHQTGGRIIPDTVAIETELRAPTVKTSLRRYLVLLREQQEALNRLNVYPVPDGDTGSNMAATMEAVVERSEKATDMAELAEAIADGSLMGAQGNSGIILSQVLRAFASTLEGRDGRRTRCARVLRGDRECRSGRIRGGRPSRRGNHSDGAARDCRGDRRR